MAKRKWNRAHEFARKKSTNRKVGHPVYVFGKSKNYRKYLVFTHTPEKGREADYVQLKHNIDPLKEGSNEPTYLRKQYGVSLDVSLREPDKGYRIHEEDLDTVNKYKK